MSKKESNKTSLSTLIALTSLASGNALAIDMNSKLKNTDKRDFDTLPSLKKLKGPHFGLTLGQSTNPLVFQNSEGEQVTLVEGIQTFELNYLQGFTDKFQVGIMLPGAKPSGVISGYSEAKMFMGDILIEPRIYINKNLMLIPIYYAPTGDFENNLGSKSGAYGGKIASRMKGSKGKEFAFQIGALIAPNDIKAEIDNSFKIQAGAGASIPLSDNLNWLSEVYIEKTKNNTPLEALTFLEYNKGNMGFRAGVGSGSLVTTGSNEFKSVVGFTYSFGGSKKSTYQSYTPTYGGKKYRLDMDDIQKNDDNVNGFGEESQVNPNGYKEETFEKNLEEDDFGEGESELIKELLKGRDPSSLSVATYENYVLEKIAPSLDEEDSFLYLLGMIKDFMNISESLGFEKVAQVEIPLKRGVTFDLLEKEEQQRLAEIKRKHKETLLKNKKKIEEANKNRLAWYNDKINIQVNKLKNAKKIYSYTYTELLKAHNEGNVKDLDTMKVELNWSARVVNKRVNYLKKLIQEESFYTNKDRKSIKRLISDSKFSKILKNKDNLLSLKIQEKATQEAVVEVVAKINPIKSYNVEKESSKNNLLLADLFSKSLAAINEEITKKNLVKGKISKKNTPSIDSLIALNEKMAKEISNLEDLKIVRIPVTIKKQKYSNLHIELDKYRSLIKRLGVKVSGNFEKRISVIEHNRLKAIAAIEKDKNYIKLIPKMEKYDVQLLKVLEDLMEREELATVRELRKIKQEKAILESKQKALIAKINTLNEVPNFYIASSSTTIEKKIDNKIEDFFEKTKLAKNNLLQEEIKEKSSTFENLISKYSHNTEFSVKITSINKEMIKNKILEENIKRQNSEILAGIEDLRSKELNNIKTRIVQLEAAKDSVNDTKSLADFSNKIIQEKIKLAAFERIEVKKKQEKANRQYQEQLANVEKQRKLLEERKRELEYLEYKKLKEKKSVASYKRPHRVKMDSITLDSTGKNESFDVKKQKLDGKLNKASELISQQKTLISDLKETQESLKSEKSSLSKEVSVSTKTAVVKDTITTLNSTSASLEKELESINKEIKTLKREEMIQSELKKEMISSSKNKESNKKDFTDLIHSKKAKMMKDIEKVDKMQSEIMESNLAHQAEIQKLKKEFDEKMRLEKERLEKEKQMIAKEMKEKEKELDRVAKENVELKEKKEVLAKDIKEVESEVEDTTVYEVEEVLSGDNDVYEEEEVYDNTGSIEEEEGGVRELTPFDY